MPLPNKTVVVGILDSYLRIRNKSHWKIADDHFSTLTLPTNSNDLNKIKIVEALILRARVCRTIEDWTKFVSEIHEIESSELKNGNERFFVVKWFTDIPLLGHTIRAIRSYVLDCLKHEMNLGVASAQLEAGKELDDFLRYYGAYFDEITKVRDPRDLHEETVQDFIHNLVSGKRDRQLAELIFANSDVGKKENKELEEGRRAAELLAKREQQEEEHRAAQFAAEKAREDDKRHAAEINALIAQLEQQRVDQIKAAAAKACLEDDKRREAEKKRIEQAAREQEQLQREREQKAREDRQRSAPIAAQIGGERSVSARRRTQDNNASADDRAVREPRPRRASVRFDPTLFADSNPPIDPYPKLPRKPKYN